MAAQGRTAANRRVSLRCVGLTLAMTALCIGHGAHSLLPEGRQLLEGGAQQQQQQRGVEEEEPFVVKLGSKQIHSSQSLNFSTEHDIPGSMWLPIGLQQVSSGDPWVMMCLLDYKKYQDNPSNTPMFANLMSVSKCGNEKRKNPERVGVGAASLVRMSSLLKSIEESGLEPIQPKGFIYHETRCGSTLVANMLAALPPSRVFSESKPPVQGIRTCKDDGCDDETINKVLRGTITLMGRRRSEGEHHEHLYFKFQNSKFLPELTRAYPKVPWVFVFRDPVEVMVSNLKNLDAGPCVRIPRQEVIKKNLLQEKIVEMRDGDGDGGDGGGGGGRGDGGAKRGGGANKTRRLPVQTDENRYSRRLSGSGTWQAWEEEGEEDGLESPGGSGAGGVDFVVNNGVEMGGWVVDENWWEDNGGDDYDDEAGTGKFLRGEGYARERLEEPRVDGAIGNDGGWLLYDHTGVVKYSDDDYYASVSMMGSGSSSSSSSSTSLAVKGPYGSSGSDSAQPSSLPSPPPPLVRGGGRMQIPPVFEDAVLYRDMDVSYSSDFSSSCSSTEFSPEDITEYHWQERGQLRGVGGAETVATEIRLRAEKEFRHLESGGGALATERRQLLVKRSAFKSRKPESLSLGMCEECADWLKLMCDYAVEAGHLTPENALFVDYSNLPDAVPEHVFPVHFDMAGEIDETVPNWKDLMYEAAGVYSKGGPRRKGEFKDDAEAKHKSASPLIIETADKKGGLYDSYRTLDSLQSWRRPEK